MKKITKVCLFSNLSFLMVLTSSLTYGCSNQLSIKKDKSEHDYNTNLKRLTWIPSEYNDFIDFYQNQTTIKAENYEINRFDNLFDNHTQQPSVFANFNVLNNSLTSTKIGNYYTNVNWTSLYQYYNVKGKDLSNNLEAQLRFYNIIAAVFGKDLVLKLVQQIIPYQSKNGSIGDTSYSSKLNGQFMRYSENFTNINLLNESYNVGKFAGTGENYVVEHEYGHAFSNFLGTTIENRSTFNNQWLINNNYLKNNFKASYINDRTQLLLDYLNDQGNKYAQKNNLSEYYYPKYALNFQLYPMILLPSIYSRLWIINNNPNLKDEYFAEAFAFWVSTPDQEKTWNWQIFNDFFLDVLPSYF